MQPQFAFKFANSSTRLRDIPEVRLAPGQGETCQRQGKPIQAFYTQGMQIVGVPSELIALVGRDTIASLNGGINFADVGKPRSANSREAEQGTSTDPRTRLITSVHLETPQAIYLLRIHNQVYMAMPQ